MADKEKKKTIVVDGKVYNLEDFEERRYWTLPQKEKVKEEEKKEKKEIKEEEKNPNKELQKKLQKRKIRE